MDVKLNMQELSEHDAGGCIQPYMCVHSHNNYLSSNWCVSLSRVYYLTTAN